MDFKNLLIELDACAEARAWAGDKSFSEVWLTCHRGDWLLWLASRMIGRDGWPTHQEVVLAAVACAETGLKYVPNGDERPRQCLDVVRLWAHGKATIEQVDEARRDAYAATAAAAAAYDTAAAAAYAAAAYDAAYAYAAAAYAAAYAAAAAYDASVYISSQTETANIVRSVLSPQYDESA